MRRTAVHTTSRPTPDTIVGALAARAAGPGADRTMLTALDSGGRITAELTPRELDARCRELAAVLRARDRDVIRATVDDFLVPRAQRYRRGRYSGESCYSDAHDHAALRRVVDGGYLDAAQAVGRALASTWTPLGFPHPRLTLDHVLVDPRVGVASVTLLPVVLSDHRALVADLVLPHRGG